MAQAIINYREASGIYQIVNLLNSKRYIGSAISLHQRRNEHLCSLGKNRHHSKHFQAAWNKYGRGAFQFKVLLICERTDLLFYEQLAIDGFRPEYCGLRKHERR